jgi:hypothetical protein
VLRFAAATPAGAQTCGEGPVDVVVAAIFGQAASACDINVDGAVTAADITAFVLAGATPTPTPSVTSSPASTEPTRTTTREHSPTTTPTPSPSTAPTPTATPRQCPSRGAGLVVEVDNQTGQTPIRVVVSGERLSEDCRTGSLAIAYEETVECAGTGVVACASIGALAPGFWRHSIRVLAPSTAQLQHHPALLVADSLPNPVRFTAFASVLTVRSTANTGDRSLRNALQNAGGMAKPLLIQFDPAVFPAGTPTAIMLQFQLPALATSDVTIDGTDPSGALGTRIIDAAGLPISAFAITGARNHLIGLRLRNAGDNNRDVLSISGAAADGNLVEQVSVENAASGDGIGVDGQAGKSFGASVNVIRSCEVSGASDKGIKVTTGAHARIERCWVHDNVNGGIQSTLGGHVQAWHNLVERNRGGSAQNGLSANARDDNTISEFSELRSWGNVARANGANGVSIRAFAIAHVRDDYLATNGSSGLRIFNDVGPPATALVEGTSAVCNAVDGAAVANTSTADLGGGLFGSPGNNAFTQNNAPAGGANLRNATGMLISALNNQWEHCGREAACADAAITAFDLSDHGANTEFAPAQAHRAPTPPAITAVHPAAPRAGALVRIFGSGFNVIDGHFAEDQCADVAGRNRCVPLRGNCVQIDGVSAAIEAVTPTMLVVRWPFTCTEPVPLIVKTDKGPTGAASEPFTVCTVDGS